MEEKLDFYLKIKSKIGAEKGKFGAYSPNDSSFFAPHEQFSIILDLSSSVLKVDIEGETKIKLIDHKGVVLRGFITGSFFFFQKT